MRVTLAAHGGQAAGINLRRPPRAVDAEGLPPDEARELARLVAAARAAPASGEDGPGRARDAMSYTITVVDGDRRDILRQSDAAMPPEFAALLSWLERHLA